MPSGVGFAILLPEATRYRIGATEMAILDGRHSGNEADSQVERTVDVSRRHWSAAFGYRLIRDIAAAPAGPPECALPPIIWRFWEPEAPLASRRRHPAHRPGPGHRHHHLTF